MNASNCPTPETRRAELTGLCRIGEPVRDSDRDACRADARFSTLAGVANEVKDASSHFLPEVSV